MSIDETIAKQISDYIRIHLDKPLVIASLTERFHFSKSTMERIFNKVFHQSVHQYILQERLEKSRRLMRYTDIPIKEIASLCGFHSISTFTRKFHEKFKITPAELRNSF